MKNLINKIRGILFRIYERYSKRWPNPFDLTKELIEKTQNEFNVFKTYNFTDREYTKGLLENRHFYFNPGWCDSWPDTKSIFLKECIEPKDGFLRMHIKPLEMSITGWYWDDKQNKRIETIRKIGTPYLETTDIFKPPLRVFALVRINSFNGGWLAPLWLYGYYPDQEKKNKYSEIDVFESWYGKVKGKKISQVNLHYKVKGKKKQLPSKVRFLKQHNNRLLLIRCDITDKQIKVYYDDKLVYKTRRYIPDTYMSIITNAFVKINEGNSTILDILAELPAHYDIYCIYVGAEQVKKNDDRNV